jgi:NADPH-dependent 2,4-dienoyl-CoA reductase/sulfur reductase-like enzyme
MGTGPLLQLVASQYALAGAEVVALLDTTPFLTQVKALPRLMARPDVLFKGMKLVAQLKFSGITIHRGVTPLEIHGDADTGVSGVSVRLGSGEVRRFDCDAVGLGYHLRPETQLADLARCAFEFDTKTRQFWPTVDIDGRSTTTGVYLAGDGTRTQGADGAEISGRLAAFACRSRPARP